MRASNVVPNYKRHERMPETFDLGEVKPRMSGREARGAIRDEGVNEEVGDETKERSDIRRDRDRRPGQSQRLHFDA
jgi:hypothetical protein